MAVNREALKKSLYANGSTDPHTQLLMKASLSIIETLECQPCDKHSKEIAGLKRFVTYTTGIIAGVGGLTAIIFAIIKLLK